MRFLDKCELVSFLAMDAAFGSILLRPGFEPGICDLKGHNA
jgi:hypothetical protein